MTGWLVIVIVVLVVWLCVLANKLDGVEIERNELRKLLGVRDHWPEDE